MNDPGSWCYEPPCDVTDPASWCYEPPPPTGFQIQVFSPARSMAELAPIIDEENLAWYEANGYPAPLPAPVDGGGAARLVCGLPDSDWDGDGLVGAADTFPSTLGPFIADFPIMGVGLLGTLTADVKLNVSGGTTQTNTLATVNNNSYQETTTATNTKEIKYAYSTKLGTGSDSEVSMDLGKLLKLDFSGVTGKATMKFNMSNNFDFSTSFNRTLKDESIRKIVSDVNHTITTVTTTNTTYDANSGRISVSFVLENRSSNSRSLKVKNLQFLVMAHNPRTGADLTFARAVQLDTNNIVLGSGANNKQDVSLVIDNINTNDMLNALNQGWTLEVVPARGYLLEDASTGQELTTLVNNVSYRTAMLNVNWGGGFVPLKQRVSTYTPTGLCTNIQDFLINAFGAGGISFKTNSAGKVVIDRILTRQAQYDDRDFNTLTDAEKNQYGKWVVGMYGHPLRHPLMTDTFDLDTMDVYAPYDEVYLYYLTRRDYEPVTGPLVIDYYDDSVGVIPESPGACPTNSQRVWIDMDTEDRNNASWSSPWVGATQTTSNSTRLEFCKVDGDRFRRLTESESYKYRYAVLKLDLNCPVGSVPFSRYFDNEDNNPRNSNSGNISPSSQERNTNLQFCLFRKDPSRADRNHGIRNMMSFPDLGVPYGVFVDPDFDSQFLAPGTPRGAFYTDDEDSSNENNYWAPNSSIAADAQRIISHGSNTYLYTGKVRH